LGVKPTIYPHLVLRLRMTRVIHHHSFICLQSVNWDKYTGCPRRNVPDFRRVFLMLKYTDISQNTDVQS